MVTPLAIELYAGTGSGTAGWCDLGGRSILFDLEYLPHHGEPHANARRVIQDALTLRGEQFAAAGFIWGSSPCQAYSYLAMPWSRSKCPLCKGTKEVWEWQLLADRGEAKTELGRLVKCDCKENSAKAKELRRKWELDGPDNVLFDSVARIAREASAAAGRVIPYVQENVRGAVPWVGKRDMSLFQWKHLTQAERLRAGSPDAVFGSFYLWSPHVAQIGKRVVAGRELADIRAGRGRFGMGVAPERAVKLGGGLSWSDYGKPGYVPFGFNTENEKALKGHGGTWFGVQSNGDTYDQREVNPVSGQKVPGFRFDGSGRSFQTASVEAINGHRGNDARHVKPGGSISPDGVGHEHAGAQEDGGFLVGMGHSGRATKTPGRSLNKGGKKFGTHNMGSAEEIERELGVKIGGDWFSDPNSTCRKHGSKSNARKSASALIAVIPKPLSDYIARQFYPEER